MPLHDFDPIEKSNEQMRKLFETWNTYPLNTDATHDADALKGEYAARGLAMLTKLTEHHYARAERGERPRWWEFIFRTKRAREYSAEKKIMQDFVKALKKTDPEGNLCGNLNRGTAKEQKPFKYDDYLNADTAKNVREAGFVKTFTEGFLGKEDVREEEIAFGELDDKMAKIEYEYMNADEKKAFDLQNGVVDEIDEIREQVTFTQDDLLSLDGIGPDAKEDPNASIDTSLDESFESELSEKDELRN